MRIVVDTREKKQAITRILSAFDAEGIPYERHALKTGDYMDPLNPSLIIDRKQSLDELAICCTTDRERFKRELQRAADAGAHLVILVEQNTYMDRGNRIRVTSIEDLMLWQSRWSMTTGEKVFRVLSSWLYRYPISIEFCDKRQTGKRIIEILREGAAHGRR